jgi:putative aminopeptidase FrvX
MVRSALLVAVLTITETNAVAAQSGDSDVAGLSVRLATIAAITGYEQAMVDTILRLLPGARRDRAGNARLKLGGGRTRLAACPLDEPGYVVGGIRADGYLTLRRAPGRVGVLYDQQLEGQRVSLYHPSGHVVPGVVAVRSIHLTRGRSALSGLSFSVDEAYVDVGAESAAAAGALGIRVLTPLTLAKRAHRYGKDLLAAPSAGRRAACAALLLAARQSVMRAKLLQGITIAFTVEHRLSDRGLATLANADGPFVQTLFVDARTGNTGTLDRRAPADTVGPPSGLGQVSYLSLPVRYGDTPVETVSLTDADSLRAELVAWIGGDR